MIDITWFKLPTYASKKLCNFFKCFFIESQIFMPEICKIICDRTKKLAIEYFDLKKIANFFDV